MKRAMFLTVALLLSLLLCSFTEADFGGFSGDSDYGGSSYSSSSSSDSDYGWSSNGDGGSVSTGGVAIAAAFLVLLVMMVTSNKKSSSGTQPAGASPTPADQLRPISKLMESDPHFNESAMCERIADLYVRFQKAWQQKDLAPVRPYLSERFYAQTSRQLQADYVAQQRTSYLENIAVLEVQIRGFRKNREQDELVAYLRTCFINYTRDDTTGTIVRGSTSQEIFMEYEWSLVREQGTLTLPGSSTPEANCTNCGATVDLSVSSKCVFCGTVLDTAKLDWVVAGIKGLSQRGRQ